MPARMRPGFTGWCCIDFAGVACRANRYCRCAAAPVRAQLSSPAGVLRVTMRPVVSNVEASYE